MGSGGVPGRASKTCILANGPDSFADRKIGILVTNGIDAGKLAQVRSAAEYEDVNVELVAPTVGGIEAGDGSRMPESWPPCQPRATS